MNESEKVQKINELYESAMKELHELEEKQLVVLKKYAQELEASKIESLKEKIRNQSHV